MFRRSSPPRPDWQQRLESQGIPFHTHETGPYWDESAYYELTLEQIETIESATQQLTTICLQAVPAILRSDRRLRQFGIPEQYWPWLRQSWEMGQPTIYGRFDLWYSGQGMPQLLEYNADTPTALAEAAVAQWFWLEDVHPDLDQYNSIHERLIDAWRSVAAQGHRRVHFTALSGHPEDFGTVQYLRDTAQQAGLLTEYLPIEQVAFDRHRKVFVGSRGEALEAVFKLYPWEWLLREEFGPLLPYAPTRWIEPPWKMVLSHKALLAVLWEMFPNHPCLLPAGFRPEDVGPNFIRKPFLGREGSNIAWYEQGRLVQQTDGPYGDGPFVYQALRPLPNFGGRYPVIGSWVVGGMACGMGIREDSGPITRNLGRFIPHVFTES
jgi:glutathionylspermidine synthase